MNARIAPTPVGVRRSRLNRLGMAVSTKRVSLPASGVPATGIEEVTNRSSVPSGPSVATPVVRTRPPTFSPTSVPGMRIEPGKSPADTTSFGTSGICCTDASISASRSSTAALTVGAGAAFAISARRLLAESESCFVSSSCLRSSAISRFCSASASPLVGDELRELGHGRGRRRGGLGRGRRREQAERQGQDGQPEDVPHPTRPHGEGEGHR